MRFPSGNIYLSPWYALPTQGEEVYLEYFASLVANIDGLLAFHHRGDQNLSATSAWEYESTKRIDKAYNFHFYTFDMRLQRLSISRLVWLSYFGFTRTVEFILAISDVAMGIIFLPAVDKIFSPLCNEYSPLCNAFPFYVTIFLFYVTPFSFM